VSGELDIEALDRAVENALRSADTSGLEIIGAGEITLVVGWRAADGSPYACKRLPVFDDERRYDSYRRCFDTYLEALAARGTRIVDSRLEPVRRPDGRVIAYCTQPVLDARTLAPILRDADDEAGSRLLEAIVDQVGVTVDERLGVDAQLSNWAQDDGDLLYLDVTTPLMRDEHGEEQLDTDVFLAALPWALRGVVRRFVLGDILEGYYEPRGVLLDLAGNLHKERLVRWIPALLQTANERFDLDLTAEEIARYYRRDALIWEALLRLRRVDRVWQQKVRGRTYPYLIPEGLTR